MENTKKYYEDKIVKLGVDKLTANRIVIEILKSQIDFHFLEYKNTPKKAKEELNNLFCELTTLTIFGKKT